MIKKLFMRMGGGYPVCGFCGNPLNKCTCKW